MCQRRKQIANEDDELLLEELEGVLGVLDGVVLGVLGLLDVEDELLEDGVLVLLLEALELLLLPPEEL